MAPVCPRDGGRQSLENLETVSEAAFAEEQRIIHPEGSVSAEMFAWMKSRVSDQSFWDSSYSIKKLKMNF